MVTFKNITWILLKSKETLIIIYLFTAWIVFVFVFNFTLLWSYSFEVIFFKLDIKNFEYMIYKNLEFYK